jgi:copper(I)-binding protein
MVTNHALMALSHKISLGVIALLVIGCTMPMVQPSTPELTGDAIRIEAAMSRPAPADGNGAVYFTVVNPTEEADRLMAVQSTSANVVELHETIEENGVMRMRPRPEGFEIPARSIVELKPGGKHVMLLELVEPLEAGDELSLTLIFENAGVLDLTVPVMEMTSGEMTSISSNSPRRNL